MLRYPKGAGSSGSTSCPVVGAVFKTVGRRPSASPVGSTPMCSRFYPCILIIRYPNLPIRLSNLTRGPSSWRRYGLLLMGCILEQCWSFRSKAARVHISPNANTHCGVRSRTVIAYKSAPGRAMTGRVPIYGDPTCRVTCLNCMASADRREYPAQARMGRYGAMAGANDSAIDRTSASVPAFTLTV